MMHDLELMMFDVMKVHDGYFQEPRKLMRDMFHHYKVSLEPYFFEVRYIKLVSCEKVRREKFSSDDPLFRQLERESKEFCNEYKFEVWGYQHPTPEMWKSKEERLIDNVHRLTVGDAWDEGA